MKISPRIQQWCNWQQQPKNGVNTGQEGEFQQNVLIHNGHLTEKPNQDVIDNNVTNNAVTNNSENIEQKEE